MKSQKLHKKRIPWWCEIPWKGFWKYWYRRQARSNAKRQVKYESEG